MVERKQVPTRDIHRDSSSQIIPAQRVPSLLRSLGLCAPRHREYTELKNKMAKQIQSQTRKEHRTLYSKSVHTKLGDFSTHFDALNHLLPPDSALLATKRIRALLQHNSHLLPPRALAAIPPATAPPLMPASTTARRRARSPPAARRRHHPTGAPARRGGARLKPSVVPCARAAVAQHRVRRDGARERGVHLAARRARRQVQDLVQRARRGRRRQARGRRRQARGRRRGQARGRRRRAALAPSLLRPRWHSHAERGGRLGLRRRRLQSRRRCCGGLRRGRACCSAAIIRRLAMRSHGISGSVLRVVEAVSRHGREA